MSHIVLEGFKPEKGDFVSAGPSVVEGMVNGTAVKALCGKIWVPGRNPKRLSDLPHLQGDRRGPGLEGPGRLRRPAPVRQGRSSTPLTTR